jgi:hypothetical protein
VTCVGGAGAVLTTGLSVILGPAVEELGTLYWGICDGPARVEAIGAWFRAGRFLLTEWPEKFVTGPFATLLVTLLPNDGSKFLTIPGSYVRFTGEF